MHEYKYTEEDFTYLQSLAKQWAGIHLSNTRKEFIYSRLARRVRQLKLASFQEYCALLSTGNEEEKTAFIDAITTNLTFFYREKPHYQFLNEKILPEFAKKKLKEVRIWSAGCSTGQEVYTIGIEIYQYLERNHPSFSVKLLATDIDTQVLERAKEGQYSHDEVFGDVENIPPDIIKWFYVGQGEKKGYFKIKESIQNLITFHHLNLMEPWTFKRLFQVIFCRNVMIYFERNERLHLLDKFADQLEMGGYLLIGHSEMIQTQGSRFKSLGDTIYQKIK